MFSTSIEINFVMITFDYSPDKKIIYAHYEGNITIQDILDYMKAITEQTREFKSIKILEDARNGTISPDVTDVDNILNYFKSYSKNRDQVVIATIQDKPVETALNMLFQSNLNMKNYHYKVFSTKEKAVEWLMSF